MSPPGTLSTICSPTGHTQRPFLQEAFPGWPLSLCDIPSPSDLGSLGLTVQLCQPARLLGQDGKLSLEGLSRTLRFIFIPRHRPRREASSHRGASLGATPPRPLSMRPLPTPQSPCGGARTLEGRTAVRAAVYGTSSDLSVLSTCPMTSSEGQWGEQRTRSQAAAYSHAPHRL